MPTYTLNHIHHEANDVHAAADWYKAMFDAAADEPFESGGATWLRVHIDEVTVTITDRECAAMQLHRYQGLDHFGLSTDDFDGTLARIEELGVDVWTGPLDSGDMRIVFINGPDDVKIEIMAKK